MPGVLELAELPERHRPPQSHVRPRRVESKLHPKGTPFTQARLQILLADNVLGTVQKTL
jgi:hypothetical protein